MHISWQLQDAKNRFSEVVKRAETDGPQETTRHGKKTAVVMSFEDYKKLTGRTESLYDFFRNSPLAGADFTVERRRSHSPNREEEF